MEHGKDSVAEAVAEIEERRDAMREIRRNLMALHQVLLGIAAPVTADKAQSGGNRAAASGDEAAQPLPAPSGGGKGGGMGTGTLNDYEKETRKQAYTAIVIALVIISVLVISILRVDNQMENPS